MFKIHGRKREVYFVLVASNVIMAQIAKYTWYKFINYLNLTTLFGLSATFRDNSSLNKIFNTLGLEFSIFRSIEIFRCAIWHSKVFYRPLVLCILLCCMLSLKMVDKQKHVAVFTKVMYVFVWKGTNLFS